MGLALPVEEVRNGFKILVLIYKDVYVDGRLIFMMDRKERGSS